MKERLRKSTLVLFGLILLFQVLSNLIWWQINKTPIAWDQSNHTQLALRIHYCIKESAPLTECLKISNYYPIAVHLVGALFLFVTGPSTMAVQYLGTLFWVGALIAIFFFFWTATKNQTLSLLTVASLSLLPVMVDISRYFMTDLALLGLTFAAMWCLLHSNKYQNRGYVVGAAIATGLALFTKWYAAFYLVVPYLLELWSARKLLTFTSPRARILTNLGLAALIIFVINAPWYLTNFQSMIEQTLYFAGADDSQPQNLLSPVALTWYLNLAFKYQLAPWLFLLSTAGLITFIWTEKRSSWRNYTLWYIGGGYVLFSLLGNKAIRYNFHLVVFYVFFIWYLVWWLSKKSRTAAKVLGAGILMYQLFFFINLSFGWPISYYRSVVKLPLVGYVELVNITTNPIRPARPYVWPVKDVVTDYLQLAERKQRNIRILTLVDYAQFNSSNLHAEQLARKGTSKLPVNIESLEGLPFKAGDQVMPMLSQFDYVLISTNEVGHDWHRGVFNRNAVQEYILSHLGEFTELKRYTFPLVDLDPSIINGNFLPGNRLIRQETCKTQVCNQFILLEVPQTQTP